MDFAVTTRAVSLTFTFKDTFGENKLTTLGYVISILLIILALAGGIL